MTPRGMPPTGDEASGGSRPVRSLRRRLVIAFLLLGVALFGIGLLGEYVGRIYQQVRERPRYLIQAILERLEPEAGSREATVAHAAWLAPQRSRDVGT